MACSCPRPEARPSRHRTRTCAACGKPPARWQLTEADAIQFYAGIRIPAVITRALSRLRMGGRQYGWWSYLTRRDNCEQGTDELIDALHYALFETFRQHKLEDEGKRPEDCDRVRGHLALGAQWITEAMREFEAARKLA